MTLTASSSRYSRSSSLDWSSFWMGVATATVTCVTTVVISHYWLALRQQQQQKQQQHRLQQQQEEILQPTTRQEKESPNKTEEAKEEAPAIWDAPDLELRLIRKAEAVIRARAGSNLIVVVERCVDDHNYSAILRTVEALGIQHCWLIDPPPAAAPPAAVPGTLLLDGENNTAEKHNDGESTAKPTTTTSAAATTITSMTKTTVQLSDHELQVRRRHRLFARNATEWLTLRDFATSRDCIDALRQTGHALWVTDLSQQAVPLTLSSLAAAAAAAVANSNASSSLSSSRSILPEKLAIVFGTEAVGCSQEMLQAADLRVYLPLRGFADSLNLSVATALVLHQILFVLQPPIPNLYLGNMSQEERRQLRTEWFPKLAKQRLLTSGEKKFRRKLLQDIYKCQAIQEKVDTVANYPLTKEQAVKLSKLPEYQWALHELEQRAFFLNTNDDANDKDDRQNDKDDETNGAVSSSSSSSAVITRAVAEWIENPPAPLTDLRRADPHRITFVGKHTKQLHADHWKGLAALTGVENDNDNNHEKARTATTTTTKNKKGQPPSNATSKEIRDRVRQHVVVAATASNQDQSTDGSA